MARRITIFAISLGEIAALAMPCAAEEASSDDRGSLAGRIMFYLLFVLIILFMVWLFRRSGLFQQKMVQDRALDQMKRSDVYLERSLQHLERVEEHMAKQEHATGRVVELLESIDRRLSSPGT